MNFKEYLKESEKTTESFDYEYKETKVRGKATWVLTLTEQGLNKVKHDFERDSQFFQGTAEYSFNATSWKLLIWADLKIYGADGKKQPSYRMFGLSGDYSFGAFPSDMNKRYAGNKKAAKSIFDEFIKKYNLKGKIINS